MLHSIDRLLGEEDRSALLRLKLSGKTATECLDWLQRHNGVTISERALWRWLAKERQEKPERCQDIAEVQRQVGLDKQIEGAKAEARYYKRLYKEAIKQSSGMDTVVEVAKTLSAAIPSVALTPRSLSFKAEQSQTAVAPLCDTHISESVDFEQMAGLNSYNMEIFNRRLYGWSQKVAELVKLREKYVNVPKLVVPMLGDMVSGDIHEELVKTNLDNTMGQMIRGAHMIAQALSFLSQNFETIEVPCVVGNHGRMVRKPPAKDKWIDWDFLLYQWAASFCRDHKNIKFSIPKSFLHVFNVEGQKILMLHGDTMRGGFAGIPYYGINRAVAYLRQTLQLRKEIQDHILDLHSKGKEDEEFFDVLSPYFDAVFMGHFHRQEELDLGTGPLFISGCVKGADEFSFGRLHVASKPTQLLTFWHPKYGYLGKDVIYLQHFDNSPNMLKDVLPDVWAEVDL